MEKFIIRIMVFLFFNKETLEFEKLVDDVKDISYIESLDGYLFILTRDSKLFIYDENTLEQIGSIELEGRFHTG